MLFISSKVFAITFGLSILLKFLLEFFILKKGKRLLLSDLSLKLFPAAELLQVPYIIIAGFAGMFGNLLWKERRIKR